MKSTKVIRDVKPSNNAWEDEINLYQISELQNEINYLKSRLSLIPKPIQFLCKVARELWWTLTSLVGLGWLHDGSRIKKDFVSTASTIAIPRIAPDDMPSPRIFIDVTATYKSNLKTGVQRVVRELCRHGEANGELAPVVIDHGRFTTLPNLAPLTFTRADKILLLDSSWTITNIYPPALKIAQAQGAEIILGIYDLIPLQYPGFVQPFFTRLFDEWLKTIAPFCSTALAISQYSADSFLVWARDNANLSRISSVGWFHLGADFPKSQDTQGGAVPATVDIPAQYLLSVGTIEPRKGYSIALDAFDELWLEGSTLAYVIIGRRGDLAEHIVDRIINHYQFGKKLFWPQNVDDFKLAQYYKNSVALLIPALAEGFGLPLIEASLHRKPTIASDLPVFREIAPEGVRFFHIANSKSLAEIIRNELLNLATPSINSVIAWDDATNNMIRIIKENDYQKKVI